MQVWSIFSIRFGHPLWSASSEGSRIAPASSFVINPKKITRKPETKVKSSDYLKYAGTGMWIARKNGLLLPHKSLHWTHLYTSVDRTRLVLWNSGPYRTFSSEIFGSGRWYVAQNVSVAAYIYQNISSFSRVTSCVIPSVLSNLAYHLLVSYVRGKVLMNAKYLSLLFIHVWCTKSWGKSRCK